MPEHTCVTCDAGLAPPRRRSLHRLPQRAAHHGIRQHRHLRLLLHPATLATSTPPAVRPGTYKNFTSTDLRGVSRLPPPHTPSTSVDRTDCICNAGYTGPDGQACSACLIGTYKDINGSSACLDCHTDSFQNKTAQTFCHDCIPWSSTFNRTAQTHISNCTCIPGSFREGLVLEPICRPCDPGFYAGETQCEFCSNMSYTTEYEPCLYPLYQHKCVRTQSRNACAERGIRAERMRKSCQSATQCCRPAKSTPDTQLKPDRISRQLILLPHAGPITTKIVNSPNTTRHRKTVREAYAPW